MTAAEQSGRRIYLAARYSRNAEMRGVRDVLEALGHKVTSRWIDDPGIYDAGRLTADPDGCAAFASAALADIRAADTMISFTGGAGKGGRHAEFGYALALGMRLAVAGPREHVFHTLPQVEWYPGWAHLVMAWAPEFAGRSGCSCGPDERCFDCATDEEMAAAVPPWPSMGGGPR